MTVLETAFRHAATYRENLAQRRITPDIDYASMRDRFAEALPEAGKPGSEVIDELVALGDAGLMQTAHPRFFGWVMGGSAPVAIAADWLASAWGQNAAMHSVTPTAAAVEETAAGWLLDILDLPRMSAVGFVTGGTVGSFATLAAARGTVLQQAGWNCQRDGLFGAPEVHVFLGADAHTSVLTSLRYLGFGDRRAIRIATDNQGRMDADDLARQCAAHDGPKLIIAQAGQINTGAFDPFDRIADIAQEHGAWVHVDGAFGLWSRAVPEMRALTHGIERADSWVVDGHKWLQVPFDSGYAIVRDATALRDSMAISASYLPTIDADARAPSNYVPELSRRARGLPTWAMLKTLGRGGVIEMVRGHCAIAKDIARDLSSVPGIHVLNDVVLNQVILGFGAPEDGPEKRKAHAVAVIDRLVAGGDMLFAGAEWRGEWVMRISVTCENTRAEDGHIAAAAIRDAWSALQASKTPAEP